MKTTRNERLALVKEQEDTGNPALVICVEMGSSWRSLKAPYPWYPRNPRLKTSGFKAMHRTMNPPGKTLMTGMEMMPPGSEAMIHEDQRKHPIA